MNIGRAVMALVLALCISVSFMAGSGETDTSGPAELQVKTEQSRSDTQQIGLACSVRVSNVPPTVRMRLLRPEHLLEIAIEDRNTVLDLDRIDIEVGWPDGSRKSLSVELDSGEFRRFGDIPASIAVGDELLISVSLEGEGSYEVVCTVSDGETLTKSVCRIRL